MTEVIFYIAIFVRDAFSFLIWESVMYFQFNVTQLTIKEPLYWLFDTGHANDLGREVFTPQRRIGRRNR